MAAHLDVNLRVIWTPRCSGTGEAIADHLSKHKVAKALALAGPEADQSFAKIPEALVRWLDNPSLSRVLGHAELEELAESMPVLPWDHEDRESLVSEAKSLQEAQLWGGLLSEAGQGGGVLSSPVMIV